MKKRYCYYCEEDVRPIWWFGRYICPKCLYYMLDKGDGFYKVCEKCGAKLPPDAAVCLICNYHFSGEHACKHYHIHPCFLYYIRNGLRRLFHFLQEKIFYVWRPVLTVFTVIQKLCFLIYKNINLKLVLGVVLIVGALRFSYLALPDKLSEVYYDDTKDAEFPLSNGRNVIYFHLNGNGIAADTKSLHKLHTEIDWAVQKNQQKEIKMSLSAYARPTTLETAERCVEALEDYIDRYIYKHSSVTNVISGVSLSQQTEISKRFSMRQAEHTIYVYNFGEICSKIKQGDLFQSEPNIKYIYHDDFHLYYVLDKLVAETCIFSLEECQNSAYCSVPTEAQYNMDKIYWKPKDQRIYVRTLVDDIDTQEYVVSVSDMRQNLCVVTYGACEQGHCLNRCNGLFLQNNETGMFQSVCELELQKP